jgi:hypothetical protein
MNVLWVLVAVAAFASSAGAALGWRNLARTRLLRDVDPSGVERWPSVSVVMPARNEADRVGPAIASRLADDYPGLELVLVDDRSDDGTAEVARDAAAGDPRLRIVRVDELPAGWLGKVHALDAGVRVTRGEYLLFSDADVSVEPGAVARAVAACERDGIDCLAILPEYRSASVLVDATWTVFVRAILLAIDPARAENPRSRAALGSGAFTLVRRSTLERTPGIPHLRLESADDVALAGMLKAAGGRNVVMVGAGCVSVRMYDSAAGFVRGIEKNGSTSAARPVRSLAGFLGFAAADLSPLLALAVGPPWSRAIGALACVVAWVPNVAVLKGTCRVWAPALLWPIGSLLFAFGTSRATVLALVRGGILWRGTFYPLAELTEGRRFTL